MRTWAAQSRSSGTVAGALVVLGAIAIALVSGLATAVVGPLAVAAVAGAVVAAIGLMVPLRWLIVGLLVLSFVVTGQLIYFARIEKALWFPFLVGALLLVRHPMDRMMRNASNPDQSPVSPRTPPFIALAIGLFFSTLVASTLIQRVAPLQLIVSSKEYVFLWGLYLALTAGLVDFRTVRRAWVALPWLMALQLPLIFYQRFVIMPKRSAAGSPWDAVVGAFGGDPFGGGASGAMGLFCVIGMLTVVARWREGTLPRWQAALLILSGLLSIALAEVKFMLLLIPAGFILLYLRDVLRRPVQGFLVVLVGVALTVTVLAVYRSQDSGRHGQETAVEYLTRITVPSADPDFVNLRTREMGRVSALNHWKNEHGWDKPLQLLIGHGAGSSRVGGFVIGDAAKRYPFNIARSSLAILLWETGIVGTTAYVLLLLAGWLAAYRHSLDERLDKDTRAISAAMGAGTALMVATLPYNTDLIYSHQAQILLLMSLGFAAMVRGHLLRGGRRFEQADQAGSTATGQQSATR